MRDVRVVLPDVSSRGKADILEHGLAEGCLGCRWLAEGKRAQGHSEGCRTRLEPEIAKTEDGRARLRTSEKFTT